MLNELCHRESLRVSGNVVGLIATGSPTLEKSTWLIRSPSPR